MRPDLAPDIDAGEQEQPHHVDEMPIPGRRFKAEMAGGRELAGNGAAQAHGQEDGADDDMGAMKARGHEEGRTIDGAQIAAGNARNGQAGMGRVGEGRQRQMVEAEGERRMGIFIGLDAGEAGAQQHGDQKPLDGALAVAGLDGVMRPGHRGARGQQDQGVEQREMPGIQRDNAGRRPTADADIAEEDRGIEIGPEPGDEEHHFRGDEQQHAVAQMQLHHRGVVAQHDGFLDHVAPPAGHGVEHQRQADQEDPGLAIHRQMEEAGIILVHPEHGARQHGEGAEGANDRPGAGIDQVVIVLCVAAHKSSPSSGQSSRAIARSTSGKTEPKRRPTQAPGRYCVCAVPLPPGPRHPS